MASVAVIGAGPMGLAAAWELCKAGHRVTVYEADKVIGGMSASFDFDGLKIERFYHFICRSDKPYFELMKELGIAERLRWADTQMGYYYQGRTHAWGNPLALLRFPGLGWLAKIRYGLLAFAAIKRRNWQDLDSRDAVEWLKAWVGDECYRIMWQPLFERKFYHFSLNLSAAWIWARMRRLGTSRRNLMTEQLGYLEGGSDTFIDAIAAAITQRGGEIRVNLPVDEVLIENGRAVGVRCGANHHPHQAVISTIPLPFVPRILPGLGEATLARYRAVENIAVVCVLAKLRNRYSEYFWLNIGDDRIGVPGIIEYSNLCPREAAVIYVPFYMPGDHADYQNPNDWFIAKAKEYLFTMNPELRNQDILCLSAGRYRYAQPICPPGFLSRLPPINPGVAGLLVADTSYYYPEDRSISESVKLGRRLAHELRI